MEPDYPKNLAGWHYAEEKGYVPIGDLVVKEGEHTDYKGLRIKVVQLIPPDYCAKPEEYSAGARAKIQFIDIAGDRVMCEENYRENSGLSSCDSALEKIDASGIGVKEINLHDRWVHFVVFGYRGV